MITLNFQEYYLISSASEISPACYKNGEVEDLTRVTSNSGKNRKSAEKDVEDAANGARNAPAPEDVMSISSSSGSTAAANNANGREDRCSCMMMRDYDDLSAVKVPY